MADKLKSWPLYVLPHHLVSRLVFRLTRLQCPRLVPPAIRAFSRAFAVNLVEAANPDPASYDSFNAFFTRALKPGVRSWAMGRNVLACPVDGCVSQHGRIAQGRIIQAKGHDYSVLELLGGNEAQAAWFQNGQFVTLYLSPRDYHRIHMPLDGSLLEQVHVPGRLFSVAAHTARTIPRLFARNERVVALFDTPFGKLAMVLVGAVNVAAIETVWSGLVTPPAGWGVQRRYFPAVHLEKGAEMGRFNMGSTVILLLQQPALNWHNGVQAGMPVRLGQALADFAVHHA